MKIFCPVLVLLLVACYISCSKTERQNTFKTVYIENTDDGYRMIRNNEPFFIKGASGNSFSNELKVAGGNTVRIYDTTGLKSSLDRLDSLGLAAVVDIYLPKYNVERDTFYNNSRHMAQLKTKLSKFVTEHKDHPALLFWMLGNEVYYPNLFSNDFVPIYNDLIKVLHETDKNHPVSTTISSAGLKKVPGILLKSPELDFISINDFGALHDFEYDKDLLFFWQEPYLIAEWGIHGPWEVNQTEWMAPIELSSSQKAETLRHNYLNYIKPIDDGRFLGSLIFYWGQKQERTHTWFSLFSQDGKKTQAVHEMRNLWNSKNSRFEGPQIETMKLDSKKAGDNIYLETDREYGAEVNLQSTGKSKLWTATWQIKPENWYISPNDVEKEPETIEGLIGDYNQRRITFKSPSLAGPYRLFVKIEDSNGYIANANIPFYAIRARE